MKELHQIVSAIEGTADLARFIRALAEDFRSRPQHWENASLDKYLVALANWLDDCDGCYRNRERIPAIPSWKGFAEMLMAAKIYE